MNKFVCIHGHFYQPPRENPWLEEVEIEKSAYPYHDWNERVTAECYAPNAASRIVDSEGRIIDIVSNYSKMSFNFGPTLLYWMERHAPDVYTEILDADRRSRERFSGHGSALAQAYNHIIMPLANRRDKYTQVKWGICDFEARFKRSPEGMWLPETAVDVETLEALSAQGLKFTILAPHQAAAVREIGSERWFDVNGGGVDMRQPYLCRLPSGGSVNIFFYDRDISHDVAFGGLLNNGAAFARRFAAAFSGESGHPQIVQIATDGETYGHHHRFGEMALSYCLYLIESGGLARLTNYGEFLEKSPPRYEVKIVENTSWSCAHGVERWRRNCGCNTGVNVGWSQEWRRPLRAATDSLRDKLALLFGEEASKYLKDPWSARDDYISVILDRSQQNVESYLAKHAVKRLSEEEKRRVLKLLEMQRHAQLMQASCGWFFDDIYNIGAIQVMRYASRSMHLAEEFSDLHLEPEYLRLLEDASSNVSEFKNGARVFEMFVQPSSADLLKVCMHYAVSSLFNRGGSGSSKVYCYTVEDEVYDALQSGRLRLAVGRSRISSDVTWDEKVVSFAALWLGDHNVSGGASELMSGDVFSAMRGEVESAFERASIQEVIMLVAKHFVASRFSLKDLFKDKQRAIVDRVLQASVANVEFYCRQVFKDNHPVMHFLGDIGVSAPSALQAATDIIVSSDIRRVLVAEEVDLDMLKRLVEDAQSLSTKLDGERLGLEASDTIYRELKKLLDKPESVGDVEKVERLVMLLSRLPIRLDVWRSQNVVFSIGKQLYSTMMERGRRGDVEAVRWLAAFERLNEQLGIKL